jgi:hypothetical protein
VAARPRSRRPAPAPAKPGGPAWFEAEVPLGTAAGNAIRRLVHRARYSWPVCLLLALGTSAALTGWRARIPSQSEVTVVLRAIEGTVGGSEADLGTGALRGYITNVVFTTAHLVDLMKKRFPAVEQQDPTTVADNVREQTYLSIQGHDLVEDFKPEDMPRSARITLTFRGGDPQATLTLARDLADLVVSSTLERRRQSAERNLAAATQEMTGAQATAASVSAANLREQDPRVRTAQLRLHVAGLDNTTAQLDARAAEEQQALRFETVDAGSLPRRASRRVLLENFVLTFLGTLVAVGLLAGAFDPRVLDTEDLTALGLPPLGHVPALPGGALARQRPDRPSVGEPSAPRV